MLQEAVTNTFRSASSPQSEVTKQRRMFPFFEKICELWINKIKQMTNVQFHSKQIISYVVFFTALFRKGPIDSQPTENLFLENDFKYSLKSGNLPWSPIYVPLHMCWTRANGLKQECPNDGSWNLCMRLFELSEKICNYFLFFISIA